MRRLRVVSVVVILFLIAFIVVDGQPDSPTTFGALIGALIVFGGFEAGFRWPSARDDDPSDGGKP